MEQMAISKFKATCLAVLERVRKTGRPVLVTKRGRPIAQVVPPPKTGSKSGFGCMRGTVTYRGDIIEPALPPEEWDALR